MSIQERTYRSEVFCFCAEKFLLFRAILFSKHRLFTEATWIFLGQVVFAVSGLIGTRILTEIVTPNVFGTVSLLLGISALLQNVFSSPILQAVLRFYPEKLHVGEECDVLIVQKELLTFASGMIIVLILLGGFVYTRLTGNISYMNFIVLSGLLLVEISRERETTILTASRRQKHYALWNMADSFSRPLCAILMVLLLRSASEYMLLGYFFAIAINYIGFRTWVVGKHANTAGRLNATKQLKSEMLAYALPLIPLAFIGWISALSSRYIIGGVLSIHDVGIFAAVFGLVSMPFLQLQSLVETTLRPVYFDAVTSDDNEKSHRVFLVWVSIVGFASIIGVLCIILFKEPLIHLLLSERYHGGVKLMPWIASGYAMLMLSYVFAVPCYAAKKTKKLLVIQGTGALATILLSTPLIVIYGMPGAAYTVTVAFCIQLCVSIAVYVKSNVWTPNGSLKLAERHVYD